jgi:hypothetical protein
VTNEKYIKYSGLKLGVKLLGRNMCRTEDNVKTYLKEILYKDADWNQLAHDRIR